MAKSTAKVVSPYARVHTHLRPAPYAHSHTHTHFTRPFSAIFLCTISLILSLNEFTLMCCIDFAAVMRVEWSDGWRGKWKGCGQCQQI